MPSPTGPARAAAYADTIRDRVRDSAATKRRLADDPAALATLARIAAEMVRCLGAGGTVFFFGNGGSSTDAAHLSAELVGRFGYDRPPLSSINLSDNGAAVTAIANDYSYEEIFARQLTGMAKPGDVAVGLSTSGRSPNVVRALSAARPLGLVSVAFTGATGGPAAEAAQLVFRAPSTDTPRVQECHLLAGHALCEIVESELFPRARTVPRAQRFLPADRQG